MGGGNMDIQQMNDDIEIVKAGIEKYGSIINLAKKIGVTPRAIHTWLNGSVKARFYSIEAIEKLLKEGK